jgi:hypothetical protein
MDIYPPTFLYIKQHAITGKLYFGKTAKDPETYLGSGTYWRKHIKKHGTEHVITVWYCLFYDTTTISEFALSFSAMHNIVESTDWANLRPENGLDGNLPGNVPWNVGLEAHNKGTTSPNKGRTLSVRSQEHKDKISASLTGKTKSSKPQPNRKARVHVKHDTVICPHCGKTGGSNIMGRWHFSNCPAKTCSTN